MPNFAFDDTKGFDSNLDAFLDCMATDDPEMGAMLRTHISKLKKGIDDASRRSARTEFNASVKSGLDDLLQAHEKKDV